MMRSDDVDGDVDADTEADKKRALSYNAAGWTGNVVSSLGQMLATLRMSMRGNRDGTGGGKSRGCARSAASYPATGLIRSSCNTLERRSEPPTITSNSPIKARDKPVSRGGTVPTPFPDVPIVKKQQHE